MNRPAAMVAVLMALAGNSSPLAAQPATRATVREYARTFTTYPYSDPNPIATVGRIYPYFRFDGYTDRPVAKAWKVVELENEYLVVRVLPEIGGKIWSAIDKTSGKPFIYDNGVVKFRDIAMRGPWTSGGIEANYGIIGHTPNCSTPVDYVARTHEDGSASVVIGALDLLTRTSWRLEVRLPANVAYFTTRSLWQNATPLEGPYYTWMNAGLKASGGLQFIYPGTHAIGHEGEVSPWPLRAEDGRDLSYYDRNDFGSYKSYHVVGQHTDFFGAYYHDEDTGVARYSTRDDKPGKKIWIWGLSPQGMIWEKLLTDGDGQYVEVQSGRLFNQSAAGSTLTPFKHRGFAPGATDTWTEFWFPVKGTRGFVAASDIGALNLVRAPGQTTIFFSPTQRVDDVVEVFDEERLVYRQRIAQAPLHTWSHTISADIPDARLRVRVGGSRLEYVADPARTTLSRPLVSSPTFDWTSAYGLSVKGKELIRQREYVQARAAIEESLRKAPHYVPALADLAQLQFRAMEHQAAFESARAALAVDTYDPAANYYYGLAAAALGRRADARDGFEIASQSIEFRGAAWGQLARLALRAGDRDRALAYAGRSVQANALDVDALQLIATIHRLRGDAALATDAQHRVLAVDPLNHHARAERFLASDDATSRRAFVAGIRNELPHETFLEIAAWYRAIGRDEDAGRVLAEAPDQGEVLYWRAALLHAAGNEAGVKAMLARADAASPEFVFPFRPESARVMAWAAGATGSWKPRYYLALIDWAAGRADEARSRLEAIGGAPDFAPFFVTRAAAREAAAPEAALADLLRATALDTRRRADGPDRMPAPELAPREWRVGVALAQFYLRRGDSSRAVSTASWSHQSFPDNYIVGMLHAKTLIAAGKYREGADVLAKLRVLPYEGSTDGRRLHREAHLRLALEALAAHQADAALREIDVAREWPENLGAGRPYAADIDERLEDWLAFRAHTNAARASEAAALLERIRTHAWAGRGAGGLVAALALDEAGRADDAARALESWAQETGSPVVADWGRRVFAGASADPAPGEEYRLVLAAQAERR